MSMCDPSVTTSPSIEDVLELEEARAYGFDSVEEMHFALEEFSNYQADEYWMGPH